MGFWKKLIGKLKKVKEELAKDSVSQSHEKRPDCCNPPEEIFKKKKVAGIRHRA